MTSGLRTDGDLRTSLSDLSGGTHARQTNKPQTGKSRVK